MIDKSPLITARQRSFGKVMFSVSTACLSLCSRGEGVSVQGPVPPLYRAQDPRTYDVRIVSKQAVVIRLKCFIVYNYIFHPNIDLKVTFSFQIKTCIQMNFAFSINLYILLFVCV